MAVKSTIEGITVHLHEKGRGRGMGGRGRGRGSMIMEGLEIDPLLLPEEGHGLDQGKDGKDKNKNKNKIRIRTR